MPAVPSWPPRSLPRLFVRAALAPDVAVALDPGQANYLCNVLRLDVDGAVLLFDGASGEWEARIAEAGRKRATLIVGRQRRPAEASPDLTLAFAPVKRAPLDWLVEKATEIGVAALVPLITRRTVVDRVKRERMENIAIEAAEQCGRTVLPNVSDPVALDRFLASLDATATLLFADEQGGMPIAEAASPGPTIILTGPEGGFTDAERAAIRAAPGARAISLGPRILRAETAALAAAAAWMVLAGDWRASGLAPGQGPR